MTSKMTHYLLLVTGNIVIFGVILIVVEGIASYMLTVYDIMTKTYPPRPPAERRHTRYDPDLGWVNERNVQIVDMYGAGVYLRTNNQGFRNNHDFDTAVANDKYRIICSGDSFTLGYGVDNDHTWCQLLTSLDPRLETVNMGQGGYGIDQMYLWYKRDGAKFEHQVQLLAFITSDFYRMQSYTIAGYGKPVIKVKNGTLVVKNVPVPRRGSDLSWLTNKLSRLRTVELLRRVRGKLGFAPENTSPMEKKRNERTRKVLMKLFEDLKRLNEERGSKLVLVYLPTQEDLIGKGPQEWIQFIEKESQDLAIPLINVLGAFRSLLLQRHAVKMFIPEGQLNYPHAAGHLNDQGNEFVAEVIYQELKNDLAISKMLSPSKP